MYCTGIGPHIEENTVGTTPHEITIQKMKFKLIKFRDLQEGMNYQYGTVPEEALQEHCKPGVPLKDILRYVFAEASRSRLGLLWGSDVWVLDSYS